MILPFTSLPCIAAQEHIQCSLNRNEHSKGEAMGCRVHRRSRKQAKKDSVILSIYGHCWCGHDMAYWYDFQARKFRREAIERPFCTPEKHFTEQPYCRFSLGWKKQGRYSGKVYCGWHGLDFQHCRLCLLPLEEMTLAQKILKALKASVAQWQSGPL